MEENKDIRWLQRYDNYKKALNKVTEITDDNDLESDDLSSLEKEGLIKRFEYTYELAWKVLQDLLLYKGYDFQRGPNGSMKKAFEDGLITDHDAWRRMANARIITSHTYNESDAEKIAEEIFSEYSGLLKDLGNRLEQVKLDTEMGNLFK